MSETMMSCPRCRNRYPQEYKKCPVDGEALVHGDLGDPLVGTLLIDTYRILKLLGQGGMAGSSR